MKNTFAFIGFGLIGASLAKSIKKNFDNCIIYAYDSNKKSLSFALDDGVLDFVLEDIDENIRSCEAVFLCTPVGFSEFYLKKLIPFINEDTIISDVGSTKNHIHLLAKKLNLENNFIGGHPMAGSEKSGYEHSTHLLLENAYYLLTTGETFDIKKLERLKEIVTSIKSIPFSLDYIDHDNIVACISHLPHIISASLVNLVEESDNENEDMKRLAAGGFKDLTRIASSSPIMWQQICESNQTAIIKFIDKYIDKLNFIKYNLENETKDFIFDLFTNSGKYRNSLPDKQNGLISISHRLSVDVEDKAGQIAIVSTLLSAMQISIKNIGINHSRELGEGALSISFYDADSCELAAKQLQKYNYKITRY